MNQKTNKSTKDNKKIDERGDTTSVSVIDTQELNDLIQEDLGIKKEKESKHIIVNSFLIILLVFSVSSLVFSFLNKSDPIISVIGNLVLTIFSIIFVYISFNYNKKNKFIIFLGTLTLLIFFFINIMLHLPSNSNTHVKAIIDFRGKNLSYVMDWANKNNISVHQEYEYSDMIDEYLIISQNYPEGTSLKKVKDITVSVSEGPNPSKEIVVPNMVGWDSERVIKYVKDNYLSNVVVEFVESDKAKDTVIEQNVSGSLKRSDEIKLTFSYGEELGFDSVTLIDFKNKSRFEVEFYMKQNQLRYEFLEDFDKDIKAGYAVSQSVAAGEVVSINDQRIEVTISKGPKIKVPDLSKYSVAKITEWAIKNKLKLSFSDRYDDTIEENHVIETNYSKGDITEQGSVVKIVLSRGSLKMPKFKSLNDFYSWANNYDIRYEEKHEFSDTVSAGEVISYSYKVGEKIKNDDIIVVTISDGEKIEVPNLKGLTKNEAITKLKKLSLKYNFVYQNSDIDKDKVISQSIRAGSELSKGTTITITLSNGKGEDRKVSERKTDKSSNNNTNNNSNNNEEDVVEEKKDEKTCNSCSFRKSHISTTVANYNTCSSAKSALKSFLEEQCPGLVVNVSCVNRDGYNTNDFVDGYNGGNITSCDTISITLAN